MTEQQEQDVKRRILLAAKKLFARQGYDGTSVRQICEEAGANVALVSYHFGGKEKVFEEVLRNFLPSDRLAELEALIGDPAKGVCILITEVIRLGYTDPDIKALLHVEIAVRSERLPILQQVALPFWNGLRKFLHKGKEMGIFHYDSLDQALFLVMGTLFIHTKAHYFEPIIEQYPFDFDRLVQETCKFVFQGLGYVGEMPKLGES